MREQRAANATSAQHPAANQKAQNLPMILVLSLAVLVIRLTMFAQKVRKKQTLDTTAARQATRNQ